jgi:hypothetical protein
MHDEFYNPLRELLLLGDQLHLELILGSLLDNPEDY